LCIAHDDKDMSRGCVTADEHGYDFYGVKTDSGPSEVRRADELRGNLYDRTELAEIQLTGGVNGEGHGNARSFVMATDIRDDHIIVAMTS